MSIFLVTNIKNLVFEMVQVGYAFQLSYDFVSNSDVIATVAEMHLIVTTTSNIHFKKTKKYFKSRITLYNFRRVSNYQQKQLYLATIMQTSQPRIFIRITSTVSLHIVIF